MEEETTTSMASMRVQGSVDSSNGDIYRSSSSLDKRICLVGNVKSDEALHSAALSFGVPVLMSDDGAEYVADRGYSTIFVLEAFEGPVFESVYKSRHPVLGVPALKQLAAQREQLPNNTRPLYNLAMSGVVVCFTGFRNKDDLTKLVPLVHHMGGSIRKEMSVKVTHLIANVVGGDKYEYAATFRVPIMNLDWVMSSWNMKDDLEYRATNEKVVTEHKLKPFHGAKVCFLGFPTDEEKHMIEVLEANGGTAVTIDNNSCTHVVFDESSVTEKPEVPSSRTHIVKAEWFWTSVQKAVSQEEKEYLFDDYFEKVLSPNARRDSHYQSSTPGSVTRRKRKRLHETLSSLAQQPSPVIHNKRRSSVSDAGLLSVSGSFLDCTASPEKALDQDAGLAGAGAAISTVPETPRKGLTPRFQVFHELLQTESNYVNILHTIVHMFKKHLENMPEEEALLNNTELKIIFGNLPPIYETHLRMLEELRWLSSNWSDDKSIGNIILKYSSDLLKAYPPFINFFEEMKEMLTQCDLSKPRFHAFLKACQTRPECGRQTLQDLMIRPVQRVPSIILLLKDVLKKTPKTNPDHAALDQALASLQEVADHINEDKRKTEGQRVMFDIFNDIGNCPPDLVSSHRSFVAKAEVILLSSSDGVLAKGDPLVLFLFSDQLEICKKRSRGGFGTIKSPNTVNGLHKTTNSKPYKHVQLMSLKVIKRVIDIKETDDCQKVFGLVCRGNNELKERLFTFTMAEAEEADKTVFLRTLCRQMATNACTADAEIFMVSLQPEELDISTSDISNGTLSKALKFASRTKIKVSRAFSFNKTPGKLKRAVSSIMSPFGSSTNLTPSSQLAQMRLASYNNLSELGNADNASPNMIQPQAPLSVQPTRKMKTSSLGGNSLKRL